MKRHANAPPPPCPRCLKLAWADRVRKETVMPIPDDPPLSREDNKPCCYDCAAADGLMDDARTYAAAVTARDYRLDAPKKRARKKKETWSCTCTAVVPCDGHRRES
ncbi:MAG: hypothetical protein Q7R30_12570, partial [Acidobacteriota bacterium]|nr:hypothetical protein [Acidobacteriota bacterium]